MDVASLVEVLVEDFPVDLFLVVDLLEQVLAAEDGRRGAVRREILHLNI